MRGSLRIALMAALLLPSAAWAQCTSPSGAEGALIFNTEHRVLQWCDGTAWWAAGYIDPAGPNDGCEGPEGTGGEIIFNIDHKLLQYCDGDHWQGVGGGVDVVPAGFSFADLIEQATSATVTSNTVTITGIEQPVEVTIAGQGSPQFRVNGGAWVTASTIDDGDTIQLRMVTSAALSSTHTATVAIGMLDAEWSASTAGADIVPDAFSFTDRTEAATNTQILSNTITIVGLGGSTGVSVSGGGNPQISISGGAWVTSGSISNGQTLQVRLTSAAADETTLSATVSVGGVSDQWDVTTAAPPPDCDTGPVGTVCEDGTVYAGTFGGQRIYLATADEPGTYRWKTSTSATSGTTSTTDGFANTEAMIAAGASAHPAAQQCRSKGPDWFLPSQEQFRRIVRNWNSMVTANLPGNPDDLYWTSLQSSNTTYAYVYKFQYGLSSYSDAQSKTSSFNVRCARRDPGSAPDCETGPIGSLCSDDAVFIGTLNGSRIYAAAADEAGTYTWGGNGADSAADDLGDGLANTDTLVGESESHPAAEACAAKAGADWYLPARDELNLLQTNSASNNLEAIGIVTRFTGSDYWTSSEISATGVWAQRFSSGAMNNADKDSAYQVRCVRR